MTKYQKILNLIASLPLEDKEALSDHLDAVIQEEVEALPYEPTPYELHRRQELQKILA